MITRLLVLSLLVSPVAAPQLHPAAAVTPVPPAVGTAKEMPHPQKLDELEREALRLVNEERKKANLKPLTRTPVLARIARDWSRRMVEEKFFAHRSPAGHTVKKDVDAAKIDWGTLSENLRELVRPEKPAQEALEHWMKSEIHRGNILAPEVTETGLGVWRDGERYLFTQVFVGPL